MTELEKFELVNKCETWAGLSETIKNISDQNGWISGSTGKPLHYTNQQNALWYFRKDLSGPNVLTRRYGIRQQALYLKHHNAQL